MRARENAPESRVTSGKSVWTERAVVGRRIYSSQAKTSVWLLTSSLGAFQATWRTARSRPTGTTTAGAAHGRIWARGSRRAVRSPFQPEPSSPSSSPRLSCWQVSILGRFLRLDAIRTAKTSSLLRRCSKISAFQKQDLRTVHTSRWKRFAWPIRREVRVCPQKLPSDKAVLRFSQISFLKFCFSQKRISPLQSP